ncbi:MAG: SDR family oxidoreductase [Bacteroidales bacterium]|nr:SDR family oxidoreductase [Bacteroidales bacterium]
MGKSGSVVLLTGGSSGIGAETARMLAAAGYKVYAGSRRGILAPECPTSDNLIPVVLDVNSQQSVSKVVADILAKEGHIDAVVCNAGNGIAGAVEQTSVDEAKYQFETCFFGAHRVIREVLPAMRAQKYGRIVTISSVAANVPIPYQTFYSSAKAAVLIYTKALSLEVKGFGIQCCSILPGDTKTGFTAARKVTEQSGNPGSVYYETLKKSVGRMEHDEQNGMPAGKIASAIVRQLGRRRMAATVTPRADYKAINFLVRILPTRLMLWIVGKLYA